MYKSKDFTELRNWTLSNDVEVTINDLKEAFEELTRAADIPVSIIDIEIDNSLPAIKIRSTLNSNYMGIYVYCNSNMVGMALEGKGEQIKAPDLEKLFYKAVGTVAGVYDGYQKSKNIMRRFGVSGTASALGAGAGVAVGAAIGGSVRLVAKGVKALLRDKDAYEREMGFYELVLGLGDYLIGGVDPSNIISKLRSKAEEGNAVAQYLIGSAYVEGRGVEPNLDEAVRWFALAAANNEKRSKEILAVEYLYGEKEYSIDEKITGLKYLKELADNGDEEAAINIIDIYGFGSVDGIPADIPKMIEAAEVYADRGNTYAIMVLARTYDTVCNNEKVNDADYKDDAKAAIWYHGILTLKDREYMEEASMCLANMYMEGRGVEESPEYATKCLNIAAKCGNIGAKAALAYYMTFGIGTEKDHIGAQKMCEDVIRAGDQKEKSVAYYCNYKIFDEAKKYKQSMEYARKCLECKTTDAAKTAELENYLAEKEELISKMTDEERREYLQERKPISEHLNKKAIVIIALIIIALIGVFVIVGKIKNSTDENSKTYNSNTVTGTQEFSSEAEKAMASYNNFLSQDVIPTAYKDYGAYEFQDEWKKENCQFALALIDNDDVPELVLIDFEDGTEDDGYGRIYKYNNDEVEQVDSLFMSGEGQILYYEKAGYYTDSFQQLDYGNERINDMAGIHFFEMNWDDEGITFYVDDEECSQEEYEEKLAELTDGQEPCLFEFYENTEENRTSVFGCSDEVDNDAEEIVIDSEEAAIEYVRNQFDIEEGDTGDFENVNIVCYGFSEESGCYEVHIINDMEDHISTLASYSVYPDGSVYDCTMDEWVLD